MKHARSTEEALPDLKMRFAHDRTQHVPWIVRDDVESTIHDGLSVQKPLRISFRTAVTIRKFLLWACLKHRSASHVSDSCGKLPRRILVRWNKNPGQPGCAFACKLNTAEVAMIGPIGFGVDVSWVLATHDPRN